MSFEKVKRELEKHQQSQLLRFWNDISQTDRESLLQEIEQIDIPEVNTYFARATKRLESITQKLDNKLEPIPKSQYESVSLLNREKFLEYETIGLEEISLGKVGVLLLAGGQATRLGFDHPKGMYDIGLPSHKTLFRIQAERIRRLQHMASESTGRAGSIIWYIMTSEHTMKPTREYFEGNEHFGLDKENIIFFEQGKLPCYDFNGKILLDGKARVSSAPDGNGGLYRALKEKGILQDLEDRGVEHLHAHSVDNILCKVADPVFIGYCKTKKSDCAAKVVRKASPTEPVGVVCRVEGVYKVVEYSEITQDAAERTNDDGELTFNAGNICNHYFTTDFLKKVCSLDSKLKLHVAKKKIPYVDETGERIKPSEVNGIKIEKFIFDVFEYAENFVVLEVARDEEFSALKNSDSAGKDCPSQARKDLFSLHRKYVRNAGGKILDDVDVEISPLLSYAGENIAEYVKNCQFTKSPVSLCSLEESANVVLQNGEH